MQEGINQQLALGALREPTEACLVAVLFHNLPGNPCITFAEEFLVVPSRPYSFPECCSKLSTAWRDRVAAKTRDTVSGLDESEIDQSTRVLSIPAGACLDVVEDAIELVWFLPDAMRQLVDSDHLSDVSAVVGAQQTRGSVDRLSFAKERIERSRRLRPIELPELVDHEREETPIARMNRHHIDARRQRGK